MRSFGIYVIARVLIEGLGASAGAAPAPTSLELVALLLSYDAFIHT